MNGTIVVLVENLHVCVQVHIMIKNMENNIYKNFILAFEKRDLQIISELLHKHGEYTIQNKDKDLIVDKTIFLNWLKPRLLIIGRMENRSSVCNGCIDSKGSRVLLFNEGTFPYTSKNNIYKHRGIVLKMKKELIFEIKGCWNYC